MKSDGRLARCPLPGLHGDAIFDVLCGCGHKIRKILRYLGSLFANLLAAFIALSQTPRTNPAGYHSQH